MTEDTDCVNMCLKIILPKIKIFKSGNRGWHHAAYSKKKYLDELIELYGTPDIKVITGIRRSGKSVLLQEFVTYLQSLEEPINIVMINLQELEFDYLLEYHTLHKYILDQYKEGMTNVLLIDEVQLCLSLSLQSIVFTPKESMIFTLPVQMHFC